MNDCMSALEYLVSHGCTGEFGRFRATELFPRGARVVVRSQRGLELGEVLCPRTARYAGSLHADFVGDLLRRASAEDEAIAAGLSERAQRLFEDGRRLAGELNLPLEIFDVEITLDGHQVVLYHVCWQECDERPLVSALSRKYETLVALRDLGLPAGASGCGRPDCGQKEGGGCSTCSTGGGCSSCGKTLGSDVKEYFAGLRQQMEERRRSLV
jgi:cell fate regulator YaaT (PSP1 superfamily)